MQNRVKSPPRYPICSEITHTIAAAIADDMAELLNAAAVATTTKPSIAAGNSTWTLKRVPSTAPMSELQSAIMTMREGSFPGIISVGD